MQKCNYTCSIYRLKFAFEVEAYDLDYGHPTPSPLDPKLFTSEPLLSMLRIQYLYYISNDVITNCKNCEGLDQKLQLHVDELASLQCLNLMQSLTDYLSQLMSAGSHRNVVETLQHVSVLLHTAHCLELEGRGYGTSLPKNVGSLWSSVAERYVVCIKTVILEWYFIGIGIL